ncbi:hypothetical protein M5689_021359 [Euphorbia peplus]|nr:hypothetical protein M5689_021359 [Euphorbia peplus]
MHSAKPYSFLIIFLPCLFLSASSALFPEFNVHLPLLNEVTGGRNNGQNAVLEDMKNLILERRMDELPNNNSTVILAAEKTHRRDPLAKFEYYTGGWDYRNMHYFSSLWFSAAPLFIIAVIWFVVVGLSFCCSLICCLCCFCCRSQRKKPHEYSENAHRASLAFLTIFTIAAICGCVVLYINQEKFSKSVSHVLEFILKRGLSIFDNLMSVMTALASAANATTDQFRLPPELDNNINIVDELIQSTGDLPKIQSLATSKGIQQVLSPAGLALEIIAGVMLVLTFLGFLFSILGLRYCVYMLAFIGWILVTAAFILSGVFLVFHNAVADTCVAMDEWLENPRANSPVSLQLLPCMDKKTAEQTLNTSRATAYFLIDASNKYIKGVANQQLPPTAGPLYHNQSGPLVPLVCNPFNPDFSNRKCAPAEVNISDASPELKKYTCEVGEGEICSTQGRLTPDTYEQITSSVNVSNSLYNSGEFLVELLNCSIVLKTFTEISEDYCPNLRHYSFRTYLGMLIIAASVMCSLSFWIFYGRERQHKKRYKKYRARQSHDPFAH